ncbi:MAG: leucine-rich repeat domain-containing protein [Mycoplasma sp.]
MKKRRIEKWVWILLTSLVAVATGGGITALFLVQINKKPEEKDNSSAIYLKEQYERHLTQKEITDRMKATKPGQVIDLEGLMTFVELVNFPDETEFKLVKLIPDSGNYKLTILLKSSKYKDFYGKVINQEKQFNFTIDYVESQLTRFESKFYEPSLSPKGIEFDLKGSTTATTPTVLREQLLKYVNAYYEVPNTNYKFITMYPQPNRRILIEIEYDKRISDTGFIEEGAFSFTFIAIHEDVGATTIGVKEGWEGDKYLPEITKILNVDDYHQDISLEDLQKVFKYENFLPNTSVKFKGINRDSEGDNALVTLLISDYVDLDGVTRKDWLVNVVVPAKMRTTSISKLDSQPSPKNQNDTMEYLVGVDGKVGDKIPETKILEYLKIENIPEFTEYYLVSLEKKVSKNLEQLLTITINYDQKYEDEYIVSTEGGFNFTFDINGVSSDSTTINPKESTLYSKYYTIDSLENELGKIGQEVDYNSENYKKYFQNISVPQNAKAKLINILKIDDKTIEVEIELDKWNDETGKVFDVPKSFKVELEFYEKYQVVDGVLVKMFEEWKKYEENIVIPNKFYGETITSIGPNALKDATKATTLKIEAASLTSIGSNAFDGCINIGGTFTIPSTVTSIGSEAFKNCRSLSIPSLYIDDKVTTFGDGIFDGLNSSNISSLSVPLIWDDTDSGWKRGFSGPYIVRDRTASNLSKKVLDTKYDYSMNPTQWREFLISSGDDINMNSLNEILSPKELDSFPKKTTFKIVGNFVKEADTMKFTIQASKWYDANGNTKTLSSGAVGGKFDLTANYLVHDTFIFDTSTGIIKGLVNKNYTGDIAIPSQIFGCNVVEIGDSAFANGNFKSISFVEGLKVINRMAFYDVISTFGNLPSSLIRIGEYAFMGSSINVANLNNVESIGRSAFAYSSLNSLNFGSNNKLKRISSETFSECDISGEVRIPRSVEVIAAGSFYANINLKILVASNSKLWQTVDAWRQDAGLSEGQVGTYN